MDGISWGGWLDFMLAVADLLLLLLVLRVVLNREPRLVVSPAGPQLKGSCSVPAGPQHA